MVHPAPRAVWIASGSALVATSIGGTILLAYVFHASSLIYPGEQYPMVLNSALGVLLSGLALLARLIAGPPTVAPGRRRVWYVVSGLAGCAVMTLGVATLDEYLLGGSLGVDDLLRGPSSWALLEVGRTRPSPQTTLALVCIGGAITALNWRAWIARAAAQALALATLSIALLALLGHAFRISTLYAVSPRIGMALPTATAMTCLAVGVLATPPLVALSALIARQTVGGVLARRVLPLALALPAGLIVVALLGQRAGLYGGPTSAALHVMSTVVATMAFVAWAASALDRSDLARAEATEQAKRERALTSDLTAANARLQDQANQLEEQALELEHQIDETRALAAELEFTNAELNERERRFRQVFESDLIGIAFWGPNGEITDANDAFLRVVDYGQDDLAHGRIPRRCLTPLKWANVDEQALAEIARRGVCTPYEKEIVRKDGTPVPVLIGASSLDSRRDRGVAFVLDISDRWAAEAALRQALEAAEAANGAKSEFLAVMSHELRTPLNAMLGYGDLLSMGVWGPVTDDQRDKLARMRNSAMHLLALIGQVLEFERLEARREQVVTESAEIGAFLRRTASDVEPQAMQKGLALTIAPPDEPVEVKTDIGKLRQIVLNLLTNAVKFTDQGEIRLSARRIDGDVELSVRDTGAGIEPEHRDRIFDPFWQADQRLTRAVGGAGLGLTIAQRFTQLLGGQIAVESAPGRGTVFTVRLPALPLP